MTEALSGLSKDTAPGTDKIKYSDIRNLSVDNKSMFFRLHEESLAAEQVPGDWSLSYLRPIPCKLNGYSILTMQNTMGKLMEWVEARKLAQDIKKEKITSPKLKSAQSMG